MEHTSGYGYVHREKMDNDSNPMDLGTLSSSKPIFSHTIELWGTSTQAYVHSYNPYSRNSKSSHIIHTRSQWKKNLWFLYLEAMTSNKQYIRSLVGDRYTYPSEKYELFSWDDEISNWMERWKSCFNPPTSIRSHISPICLAPYLSHIPRFTFLDESLKDCHYIDVYICI